MLESQKCLKTIWWFWKDLHRHVQDWYNMCHFTWKSIILQMLFWWKEHSIETNVPIFKTHGVQLTFTACLRYTSQQKYSPGGYPWLETFENRLMELNRANVYQGCCCWVGFPTMKVLLQTSRIFFRYSCSLTKVASYGDFFHTIMQFVGIIFEGMLRQTSWKLTKFGGYQWWVLKLMIKEVIASIENIIINVGALFFSMMYLYSVRWQGRLNELWPQFSYIPYWEFWRLANCLNIKNAILGYSIQELIVWITTRSPLYPCQRQLWNELVNSVVESAGCIISMWRNKRNNWSEAKVMKRVTYPQVLGRKSRLFRSNLDILLPWISLKF
jgi:hypothetical protein